MDDVRERLRAALGREDMTLEGLVHETAALLEELAPNQPRYKVTERPDARTIRYYVSQKLLPKPVSYEGGRARYSGRHLARLLLIKKLQSEHHTLQRIARVLETSSDEELMESLFPGVAKKGRRPAATKRVKAAYLVDTKPGPSPRDLLQRHDVGLGATLDVPERVLKDTKSREALASRLERLARWLRTGDERSAE